MTIAIFMALILLSGYIANFSTYARFALAKAFGFFLLETILGILFFILSLFSLMWLGVLPILLNGIGSFFYFNFSDCHVRGISSLLVSMFAFCQTID